MLDWVVFGDDQQQKSGQSSGGRIQKVISEKLNLSTHIGFQSSCGICVGFTCYGTANLATFGSELSSCGHRLRTAGISASGRRHRHLSALLLNTLVAEQHSTDRSQLAQIPASFIRFKPTSCTPMKRTRDARNKRSEARTGADENNKGLSTKPIAPALIPPYHTPNCPGSSSLPGASIRLDPSSLIPQPGPRRQGIVHSPSICTSTSILVPPRAQAKTTPSGPDCELEWSWSCGSRAVPPVQPGAVRKVSNLDF
jgi:hypothetical protein